VPIVIHILGFYLQISIIHFTICIPISHFGQPPICARSTTHADKKVCFGREILIIFELRYLSFFLTIASPSKACLLTVYFCFSESVGPLRLAGFFQLL